MLDAALNIKSHGNDTYPASKAEAISHIPPNMSAAASALASEDYEIPQVPSGLNLGHLFIHHCTILQFHRGPQEAREIKQDLVTEGSAGQPAKPAKHKKPTHFKQRLKTLRSRIAAI